MTTEELNAFKQWLDKRPRIPHVCAYSGIPNVPGDYAGPVYECVHGKRLTWTDARKALGLPV